MSLFDKQSRTASNMEANRLETPSMTGYRAGMSSSIVIGRRLGSVFGLQANLPREMDNALGQLHRKLGRTR